MNHNPWIVLLGVTAFAMAGAMSTPEATDAAPRLNQHVLAQATALSVAFAGSSEKSGGHIKVRIAGPGGRIVFEASSDAGILDWYPDTSLPDGRYRYDAWFTLTADLPYGASSHALDQNGHDADGKGIHPGRFYESGEFRLQEGIVVEQ